MKRILASLAFLLFGSLPSGAVIDGTEDREGRYPYVVMLLMEFEVDGKPRFPGCSAVALSPTLVLTAAHCLVEPFPGWKYIGSKISYVDRHGIDRTVPVAWASADSRFARNNRERKEIIRSRDAFFKSKARGIEFSSQGISDRDFSEVEKRLAAIDLAAVMVATPLDIDRFPIPVWSFLSPGPFRGFRDAGRAPDAAKIEEALKLVGAPEFERGIGRGYVATAVGFGFNKCPNPEDAKHMSPEEETSQCSGVGKRRFGKMRLATGETCFSHLRAYKGSPALGVDPWCAIRPSDGVDITYGDSGGPLMVETKLGDILLGVHSGPTTGSSESWERKLSSHERVSVASIMHDLEFLGPVLKRAGYPIRREVRR